MADTVSRNGTPPANGTTPVLSAIAVTLASIRQHGRYARVRFRKGGEPVCDKVVLGNEWLMMEMTERRQQLEAQLQAAEAKLLDLDNQMNPETYRWPKGDLEHRVHLCELINDLRRELAAIADVAIRQIHVDEISRIDWLMEPDGAAVH